MYKAFPMRSFSWLEKRCTKSFFQINRRIGTIPPEFFKVGDHVKTAFKNYQPVIALESTIITHGMPYPDNLSTALKVENIVKKYGAYPATVGVIDGKLIVGLDTDEIKYLSSKKTEFLKISKRDLSYVLSKKLSGGTTVSSTMFASHLAGIKVFVTGGIGGVHREVFQTLDISSDLTELGRTPVAVVCAGIKSILDIKLTLEYLETLGVPVITYGKSKTFPAFYCSDSGHMAPMCLDNVEDIAKMLYCHNQLGVKSGVVIGVPIPEEFSADSSAIENIIQKALAEASSKNIVGKDITPFILNRVVQLSDGKSLVSNIMLIENNAKVGAQIAKSYSSIVNKHGCISDNSEQKKKTLKINMEYTENKRPVVIGGSVFDIVSKAKNVDSKAETKSPGNIYQGYGGVARNIAECLTRLGTNPFLISTVGLDDFGEMMIANMQKINMDTSGVMRSKKSTACYSAMLNKNGDLLMGVGDMDINEELTPITIEKYEGVIQKAPIVIMDANSKHETIQTVLLMCKKHNVPVWFEPTSVSKASVAFSTKSKLHINFASPNFNELKAIHTTLSTKKKHPVLQERKFSEDVSLNEVINNCVHYADECAQYVNNLIVTLGKHGVLVLTRAPFDEPFSYELVNNALSAKLYPSSKESFSLQIKNASGAGDSFVAGVVFGILQKYDADTCIRSGLLAANLSLQSYNAISEEVTPEKFSFVNIRNWGNFEPQKIF
ncbi:uncharacterized protein LOC100197220 isoform X1 [Hydra vulgaris]|uniref:uncharacterized protein LOC100197220 isoform X1 n=1 Tax=Hydra vulgaris TaxID=6087 RepID=UPI0006413560|nr:pseudouridine-metabolizing bifunctional protein C1861.05 [Hydra vulgaris]